MRHTCNRRVEDAEEVGPPRGGPPGWRGVGPLSPSNALRLQTARGKSALSHSILLTADFACPREAGRLRRLRGPAKNARGQQKTKVSVEHGATVHMFEWDAGESTPVSLLADARGLWGQHGRVDGWARGPRRDALGHGGEKVFADIRGEHGLKKRWKQLRECHRMNDRISLDKPSESGMRPSIPKKFFRVLRAEIKPRKTSSEFDGILRNSRGFLRTDKTYSHYEQHKPSSS